jgi:hypothetical protein
VGIRAKASALQVRTIGDSFEDHESIADSLAADILGDTMGGLQDATPAVRRRQGDQLFIFRPRGRV